MTIPLKRFETLDSDFHVGVGDFASAVDTAEGTLNQVAEFNESTNTALQPLVDQLKQQIVEVKAQKDAVMGGVKSAIDGVTRKTNDMFSSFSDLASLPGKMVNSMIDDLFGEGDQIGAGLKNVAKVCRDRGMGRAPSLGNFNSPGCGDMSAGSGNCSSNSVGQLLTGSTTGMLSKAFNAINNLIKKVMGLAGLGFNANLCNVMGPLLDSVMGIGQGKAFATAGAALGARTFATGGSINIEGLAGNIPGVADIAKNVSGLAVASVFPNTIKNIASNVDLGKLTGVADKVKGVNTTLASLELVSSTFDRSSDGLSSMAGLGTLKDSFKEGIRTVREGAAPVVSALNNVSSSSNVGSWAMFA